MISDSSRIIGIYKPGNHNYLKADIFAPEFVYKNNSIRGLVLNISSDDSIIYANLGSQNLNLNKRFNFANYELQTSTIKNRIEFKTKWLNWDTLVYKGNLSGNLLLGSSDSAKSFLFSMYPSEIIVNDSLWKLSACKSNVRF